MSKKRSLFPEDEEEIRKNTNPFAKRDEKGGVDLEDSLSPRNSFLDDDDDDLDFPDDDDDIDDDLEDDEDIGDSVGMDSFW